MVEGSGLENRRPFTGSVGSNPTASFSFAPFFVTYGDVTEWLKVHDC